MTFPCDLPLYLPISCKYPRVIALSISTFISFSHNACAILLALSSTDIQCYPSIICCVFSFLINKKLKESFLPIIFFIMVS